MFYLNSGYFRSPIRCRWLKKRWLRIEWLVGRAFRDAGGGTKGFSIKAEIRRHRPSTVATPAWLSGPWRSPLNVILPNPDYIQVIIPAKWPNQAALQSENCLFLFNYYLMKRIWRDRLSHFWSIVWFGKHLAWRQYSMIKDITVVLTCRLHRWSTWLFAVGNNINVGFPWNWTNNASGSVFELFSVYNAELMMMTRSPLSQHLVVIHPYDHASSILHPFAKSV